MDVLLEKLFSAQADIKRRVDAHPLSTFISQEFLKQLNNILETHRDHITGMDEALRWLLSTYDTDLRGIRVELARIPVEFKVVSLVHRYSYYGTPQYTRGLEHGNYKYIPHNMSSLDDLCIGDSVWRLISKETVNELEDVPYIPCWNAYDSPVDWIIEYLKTASPTENESTAVQKDTELTPTQRIYQYIRNNRGVATRDILAQKFAGRSRTFEILKTLQRDGKIEKDSHGVYKIRQNSDVP